MSATCRPIRAVPLFFLILVLAAGPALSAATARAEEDRRGRAGRPDTRQEQRQTQQRAQQESRQEQRGDRRGEARRDIRRDRRGEAYEERRQRYEQRYEYYRRDRHQRGERRPRVFHRRGHRVDRLPERHLVITLGSVTYYYWDGVFFEPHLHGYVVVSAPIGARVRYLPAGYISFHIGLFHYFFVNDAYYLWDPYYREYVVVEKPAGAKEAMGEAEVEGELYAYPAEGQSEEQSRKDRFECHEWAVDETGFDPTLASIDSPGRADYRRAMTACLEGRGYTVK